MPAPGQHTADDVPGQELEDPRDRTGGRGDNEGARERRRRREPRVRPRTPAVLRERRRGETAGTAALPDRSGHRSRLSQRVVGRKGEDGFRGWGVGNAGRAGSRESFDCQIVTVENNVRLENLNMAAANLLRRCQF